MLRLKHSDFPRARSLLASARLEARGVVRAGGQELPEDQRRVLELPRERRDDAEVRHRHVLHLRERERPELGAARSSMWTCSALAAGASHS